MARELDVQVEASRSRLLDTGPYTCCWADALTIKVREAGRIVNVYALIAVAVNADGLGILDEQTFHRRAEAIHTRQPPPT